MYWKHLFAFSVVFMFLALPLAYADEVTRTFSTIKPSLPKTVTENVLSDAGTPVYEIRIDVSKTLFQARLGLDKFDLAKSKLSVLPGGVVYDYFNITGKNLVSSDIESLRISFRVPVSWAEEKKVKPGDVKLLATSKSEIWLEVETNLTTEGADYLEYVSEVRKPEVPNIEGEGTIFAIVGESAVVEPEPVEADVPAGQEQVPVGAEETVEIAPEEFESMNQQRDQGNVLMAVGVVVVVTIVALLFLVPGSFVRKGLGGQRKKFHS